MDLGRGGDRGTAIMKIYTLEVTITEGCDEFWEDITAGEATGCDDVTKTVRDILFDAGFQEPNCLVTLKQFRDE